MANQYQDQIPVLPLDPLAGDSPESLLARGQAPSAPPGGVPSLARLAYNRLGFGPRPSDADFNDATSLNAYIDAQLNYESIDDSACDAYVAGMNRAEYSNDGGTGFSVPPLNATLAEITAYVENAGTRNVYGPGELQHFIKKAGYARALHTRRQLYEATVDFWTNHFNVLFDTSQFKYWDDANVIRPYALGNFRDMLGASAKSPAMLVYLSNAYSDGNNPNENYAREVMELHTMGSINRVKGHPREGQPNYSEDDVHKLAGIFSGWTFVNSPTNEFRFSDSGQWPGHDYTAKELWLGNDSKFFIPHGGEEQAEYAMDILADHVSTAWFVARKLCRRFIADDPDTFCPKAIADGAQSFIDSKGSIRSTLGTILKANYPGADFKSSFGQKVKRPFEFYVSAMRAVNATVFPWPFDDGGNPNRNDWEREQRQQFLGQQLYGSPPPTGYPDFMTAWLNSSQVFARWSMANLMVRRLFGEQGEPDWNFSAVVNAALDTLIGANAGNVTATQVVDRLINVLFGRSIVAQDRAALIDHVSSDPDGNANNVRTSNNKRIRSLLGAMLASPYFQWR